MLPPNGRVQIDGSIIFPLRGTPPTCNLDGYYQDPDDPYRWRMIYCKCKHRELGKLYTCPSGRTKKRDFCNLVLIPINPRYCNQDCSIKDK